MKQLFFFSILLMSVVICGTAFAADITGTYVFKDGNLEGEMIIKQSGAGYSAEINTFALNTPPPGIWSGFEGEGTLKDNILTVSQDKNGNTLQISIKFSGNNATITEDDIKGEVGFFDGPSGGPGFSYTYKKK